MFRLETRCVSIDDCVKCWTVQGKASRNKTTGHLNFKTLKKQMQVPTTVTRNRSITAQRQPPILAKTKSKPLNTSSLVSIAHSEGIACATAAPTGGMKNNVQNRGVPAVPYVGHSVGVACVTPVSGGATAESRAQSELSRAATTAIFNVALASWAPCDAFPSRFSAIRFLRSSSMIFRLSGFWIGLGLSDIAGDGDLVRLLLTR